MKFEDKNIAWKDLQTKGYLVVRNVLTSDESKALLTEYTKSKGLGNASYQLPYLDKELFAKYIEVFSKELIPHVHFHTDIKADLFEMGIFFANKLGINFNWHIDPDSFYVSQDHYHYLNLYIPIRKPNLELSNLSLIPSDVLAKCIPELYEKVIHGRGALRLLPGNGKTVIFDDNDGKIYECNYSLKDLAVTPALGEGDLLLMRGDLFHKTQDKDTDRVSISFRVIHSKGLVRLSNFEPTCIRKAINLAYNNLAIRIRKLSFEHAQKTEMSLVEHLIRVRALMNNLPKLPQVDSEEILIHSLSKLLLAMPTSKIVIIESCTNALSLQAMLSSSNSLGADILIAQEKTVGILSKLYKDQAMQCIVVKNLPRCLEILSQFKFRLIGLQSTSQENLDSKHLNSHTAFVINDDSGVISKKVRALCHNIVSVLPAYGRVLPVRISTALAYGLLQLNSDFSKSPVENPRDAEVNL